MPNGFFKSEKGVAEYQKIGKEYPNTITDTNYEAFVKRNANSPHSSRNRKELITLVRELGDDGKEYLTYDLLDIRYSPLGAEDRFPCPSIGKYPIPITRPRIVIGENMQTTEIVSGDVIRNDLGYEFPFTKEKCDEIHKAYAQDQKQRGKTQYIVRRVGGLKRSIISYEDFRDGDFYDLEINGMISLDSDDSDSSEEQEKPKSSKKQ